ncbi:MAG: endonuclease/exonuclease/phosphatase family protein [Ilumatobacteraceae bacterium]
MQNLFDRARALSAESWATGRPVLEAYAQINSLLQRETYSEPTKARILELLEQLGLLRSDQARFAVLRVIRGKLLRRPRAGGAEVVASGRSDWIGWVELTTEDADELALQHTAMVVRDVDADILGVVEAEDRTTLRRFSESLVDVDGVPFEQVMLIDGNDDRGIDVGILLRGTLPLEHIRTHVFDTDASGVVFSRDCCEYRVRTPDGQLLAVLVNHFKSKGYSEPGDRLGNERRRRQATRVAAIYAACLDEGIERVAVIGDLNDTPLSGALAPLVADTDLRDISSHPDFDGGPRQGTFQGGSDKIDYVLLSPALFERATGGGVLRKGVWHGPRVKNPWEMYPTLTAQVHAASDHAAIYADVEL